LLSLFFFSLQFYDVYGGLRHLPQPYGGFCDGVCNSLAASMVSLFDVAGISLLIGVLLPSSRLLGTAAVDACVWWHGCRPRIPLCVSALTLLSTPVRIRHLSVGWVAS